MKLAIAVSLSCLLLPSAVFAEVELSFYGGIQSAQDSDVSIRGDDVVDDDDLSIDWEGRSGDAPIYYGFRATKWHSDTFGYGLDFTHNKVYPKDGELPEEYDVLEFTDGLNTLTVNAYHRWNDAFGDITPYVGGGIGVAIPYVELETEDGSSETYSYQLTGPAATWIAGATYPINDHWSVFGEYKGTFSSNSADLDTGGTLETDIVTNALNLGVSFNF